MADSKTRKRRLRQRRQQAGLKAALVWLTPEGQAAMAALRQPGETVDAVANRALVTLQRLTQSGTRDRTRPDGRLSAGAGAALLAPMGYVIVSRKTRSAERFVVCRDAHGEVERYGLFWLQPIAKEG